MCSLEEGKTGWKGHSEAKLFILLTPPTPLAHLHPFLSLQFILILCQQPTQSFFQLLFSLFFFIFHSNPSLLPDTVNLKALFFIMLYNSPPGIKPFIFLPQRNCPQLLSPYPNNFPAQFHSGHPCSGQFPPYPSRDQLMLPQAACDQCTMCTVLLYLPVFCSNALCCCFSFQLADVPEMIACNTG